jgi:hypothetical protein
VIAVLLMLVIAPPPPDITAERVVISNSTATTGTVSIASDTPADEVAMLGTWTARDGRLTFTPRFPFEPGLAYRMTVTGSPPLTFIVEKPVDLPASLERIHPTANVLPANTLRFYLHFDRPMKLGQGTTHFELLDDHGVAVANPFLPIDEELWSDDGKRLTLLFDPGRVKKDLVPRLEQGAVLTEGRAYTLVVRKAMRTATGQPLKADVRKAFKATVAIETALDPATWAMTVPAAGSQTAIELQADRALDHALLLRCLTIEDATGTPLRGTPTTANDDTVWRWTPERPWPAGRHRLVILGVLEDTCGNRIGTPFNAPLGEIGARRQKPPTVREFVIP